MALALTSGKRISLTGLDHEAYVFGPGFGIKDHVLASGLAF